MFVYLLIIYLSVCLSVSLFICSFLSIVTLKVFLKNGHCYWGVLVDMKKRWLFIFMFWMILRWHLSKYDNEIVALIQRRTNRLNGLIKWIYFIGLDNTITNHLHSTIKDPRGSFTLFTFIYIRYCERTFNEEWKDSKDVSV